MISHFVPRMYLKGWQVEHNGRQRQICVYQKGNSPEFKSLREVACRDDYYTEATERHLDREMENKTAPVLKRIIRDKCLQSADKIQLSRFMATLWFRVPFNLEGLFQQIREVTLPETIKDMEKLRHQLKDFNLPDEVFDYERFTTPEHNKMIYSELLQRDRYRTYLAFARMRWRVYEAAPGEEFVTSDNPVFFDRRIGLGHSQSFFVFPLNRHLLLEGRSSKTPGKHHEVAEAGKTDQFNREVIANCDREAYASINNVAIGDAVDEFASEARSIKHKINVRF